MYCLLQAAAVCTLDAHCAVQAFSVPVQAAVGQVLGHTVGSGELPEYLLVAADRFLTIFATTRSAKLDSTLGQLMVSWLQVAAVAALED